MQFDVPVKLIQITAKIMVKPTFQQSKASLPKYNKYYI